jgi:hypothetical protein
MAPNHQSKATRRATREDAHSALRHLNSSCNETGGQCHGCQGQHRKGRLNPSKLTRASGRHSFFCESEQQQEREVPCTRFRCLLRLRPLSLLQCAARACRPCTPAALTPHPCRHPHKARPVDRNSYSATQPWSCLPVTSECSPK